VPVDVRVVDSKGDPVTDLKKEDFTVTEDGIPQQVRLFDSHALTPEAPRPGSPPPLRKALPADAPAGTQALAQNQRIFLIVFGRGRLQWPDKGIDAAIKMVRERLLPQDRVAVLAYNRATDFTIDRAAIIATLERFKKAHDLIEADLKQQFSGLQAAYGSRTPSKAIQAEIDAVFHGSGTAHARQVPPGTPTDAAQIAADARSATDAIQRGDILAGRDPSPFDAFDRAAADAIDMTFDQFAAASAQTARPAAGRVLPRSRTPDVFRRRDTSDS
jgi:VWFA-related protein